MIGHPVINPLSNICLGSELAIGTTSFTSGTFVAANRVMLSPFELRYRYTVRKAFAYLGATLAGNFAVGIVNPDGQVIVVTASTAQSGGTINTVMTVSITETVLAPGKYFLGIGCDSASATFFRVGGNAVNDAMRGMCESTSGYSTFTSGGLLTIAPVTTAQTPMFGVSAATVI